MVNTLQWQFASAGCLKPGVDATPTRSRCCYVLNAGVMSIYEILNNFICRLKSIGRGLDAQWFSEVGSPGPPNRARLLPFKRQ